jgi:hypothetical protein
MQVWLEGQDMPKDVYIPVNAPSSTGEFADLRQEIAYYWRATERFNATGDSSELQYFTGAYIITNSHGQVKNTDRMQHDADGAPILAPGDHVYTFHLDLDDIEEAGNAGDLDFPMDSQGGGRV